MSAGKSRVFGLILMMSFINNLLATTYYVDVNGNNGNGLSWSNAKTTLAGAISVSAAGDEILIKYGTYNITYTITLTSDRKISSDPGTATSFDAAQPDSSQCILQGDGADRILYVSGTGVTNDCRIRGLKITGGDASYETAFAGFAGGAFITGGANPIIENCWIHANYGNTDNDPGSGSYGGGLAFHETSTAMLRNSRVSSNTASTDSYYGGGAGGLWVYGSATVEGNTFASNIGVNGPGSQYYVNGGGAIQHGSGHLILTGNRFESNSGVYRTTSFSYANWGPTAGSGALYLSSGSTAEVRNNIFINNYALNSPTSNGYGGQEATTMAGAISSSGNSIFENNTFVGNACRTMYAYAATATAGTASFNNNDVVRNNIFMDADNSSTSAIKVTGTAQSVAYNCFYDNYVNYPDGMTSTEEVLQNPGFVNAGAGDYGLTESSPCVDMGAPDTDTTGFFHDYEGGVRIRNGRIDMGAYEFQYGGSPEITSLDTVSAVEDQLFSYTITALDPENDDLTFLLGWKPTWLSLDESVLTGTPLHGDVDTSFQVKVTDGSAWDSLEVGVGVQQVNDLPILSEVSAQVIQTNEVISDLEIIIFDEETPLDDLVFTVSSSNAGLIPDENIQTSRTGDQILITLTPLTDVAGSSLITMTLEDDEHTISTSFFVTVEAPNQAPQIVGSPGVTATEDIPYAFSFQVSDPEGDEFQVEATAPAWLTLQLAEERIITTHTGTGTSGFNGNEIGADTAQIGGPKKMYVDSDGTLYFTESTHRVRKITPDGIIHAVAGTGSYGAANDGALAVSGRIRNPSCVTVDVFGNIYFAEDSGRRIRKIDSDGILSTYAGTGNSSYNGDEIPATSANIYGVNDMIFDDQGNLYLCETNASRIRMIDTEGVIHTVAGNGSSTNTGDGEQATSAGIGYPYGIAFDSAGSLLIADYEHHRIRKVDTEGVISTLAGTTGGFGGDGGSALNAQLYRPTGLDLDGQGNLYIADNRNNRIRVIDSSGNIHTLAGSGPSYGDMGFYDGDGGPADEAGLWEPQDVVVDGAGSVLISDNRNYRIRHVASPAFLLSGTPGNDDTGSHPITITAHDGEDPTTLAYDLEVLEVNDPPHITSGTSVSATEDQSFEYVGVAEDVDSEDLVWQALELPHWLTFQNDTLRGTPEQGDGDTLAIIRVDDGELADTSEIFIQVSPVNDTPVITSALAVEAVEETEFQYVPTAWDEEEDMIGFTIQFFPDWMWLSGDTLHGSAPEGILSGSFMVLASDSLSTDTLNVQVIVTAVNDPPILVQEIGEVEINEDDQGVVIVQDLHLYFSDVDAGDQLRYTPTIAAVGMDSAVVLDLDGSAILMGYTTMDHFGDVPIIIEAIDDSLAFVTDTLLVHIRPVNDAPVLSALPHQSMDEDQHISLAIEDLSLFANDVEDDVQDLTWIFQSGGDLNAVQQSDSLVITAPQNWFGTDSIQVIITDTEALSDTAWMSIEVLSINDAPLFADLPDTSFLEDGLLEIPFADLHPYVSDPEDADTSLIFSETDMANIHVSLLAESLNLTATPDWFGTETIKLIVTDSGGLSDTAEVRITVTPVNDPPLVFALLAPGNSTIISDPDSIDLNFSWEEAVDIEGDELTYTLKFYTDAWDSMFVDLDSTGLRMNIESFPRSEDITWTAIAFDGQDSTAAGLEFVFQVSALVGIDDPENMPEEFVLEQNYPNPFNPITTIRYGIPIATDVQLSIYDVRGRRVFQQVLPSQSQGWYEYQWTGQDLDGRPVTTGVYFARVSTREHSQVIKMLLLK